MAIEIPENATVEEQSKMIDGILHTRIVITGQWKDSTKSEPEVLPHSRACGFRPHEHGDACSTNCPTCHGKSI